MSNPQISRDTHPYNRGSRRPNYKGRTRKHHHPDYSPTFGTVTGGFFVGAFGFNINGGHFHDAGTMTVQYGSTRHASWPSQSQSDITPRSNLVEDSQQVLLRGSILSPHTPPIPHHTHPRVA
ncbi:hypothetical protein BT96DRAFT_980885 [Gymnopus androsaceus JB14]|uniref:Uncharacterized protein n=1 Tax=Gymnopus androsaceus JB14 TaxID=1447944 RepID=A0A6A4GUU7_9AGAR|nr:hypothetical protein BT96DRAFT_980885 [Gymnopus androsaceus JB14]